MVFLVRGAETGHEYARGEGGDGVGGVGDIGMGSSSLWGGVAHVICEVPWGVGHDCMGTVGWGAHSHLLLRRGRSGLGKVFTWRPQCMHLFAGTSALVKLNLEKIDDERGLWAVTLDRHGQCVDTHDTLP